MHNNIQGNQAKVFETFKVGEKFKRLKEEYIFDGKNIMIAVPSLDESMRCIEKEDVGLYNVQLRDAYKLALDLEDKMMAKVVGVVASSAEATDVVDQMVESLDYLILLHEFMPVEKNHLVEELKEDQLGEVRNQQLQVIELY